VGDWRENAPAALALEMPPGEGVNQHAHPCHRFEVVVRGTLDVGQGRILRLGDGMGSGSGGMYGSHVAGLDGATTFEIFSNFDASYRIIYDTPEGRVEVNGTDPNTWCLTRIYGAKFTSLFGRA